MNALLYLAEDRHLFSANGLSVSMKGHESGRTAVDGLLAHEVDVATAGEYVAISKMLEPTPLRIFASIAKSQNTYLLARRDRGIASPADRDVFGRQNP